MLIAADAYIVADLLATGLQAANRVMPQAAMIQLSVPSKLKWAPAL